MAFGLFGSASTKKSETNWDVDNKAVDQSNSWGSSSLMTDKGDNTINNTTWNWSMDAGVAGKAIDGAVKIASDNNLMALGITTENQKFAEDIFSKGTESITDVAKESMNNSAYLSSQNIKMMDEMNSRFQSLSETAMAVSARSASDVLMASAASEERIKDLAADSIKANGDMMNNAFDNYASEIGDTTRNALLINERATTAALDWADEITRSDGTTTAKTITKSITVGMVILGMVVLFNK